jgi:hypothetical protein
MACWQFLDHVRRLTCSLLAPCVGLNTAFASLYCDDYEVNVSNLVSVIAAASMLQLDGLLSKSAAAVEKHINNSTVSNLCQAAAAYGYERQIACGDS